jgi:glycosyltransferase involved in cell wall biosynthesis
VVLVARAAPPQVAATITSILEQRAVSFELLLIADESRHEIARVVDSFSDPRLRLIPAAVPLANPQCWNQAIAASRSAFITMVGDHDRLLGSALAELVAALERDPDAGLAHGHWFAVDPAGRIPLRAFREQRERARRRLPEHLDHRRALVVEGYMVQALPTYRREVVAALGGFDESYGDGAAYALALRLLDHAEIRVVPRFLCCRPLPASFGPKRSYLRELAICRSLVHAGSARFLEAEPYRWRRLACLGLLRRLRLHRLRRLAERGYWPMRRLLRRVSPLRWLRDSAGSGRLYQQLVDRMSWWPLGRARPAAQGGATARIAYVLWRYPALSETFIRREIHALRATGVVVDVLADEPGEGAVENHPAAPTGEVRYLNPMDPKRGRRLTRDFLRSHPLRLLNLFLYSVFHRASREKTLRRDARMLGKAIYLAGILRAREATHVHAPWADQHAFLALLASRLLGLPYSVQARAHEIHRSTATFALAEKLRNAQFVVTNSAFNAAHLRPLLGNLADRSLHTIYNGIDLTQFQPPVRGREAPGPPRLLAVGRLVEQKGFDDLLRACALLRDRGLAFHCDIIGGPREPEDTNSYVELGKLHRRLGLGGQVCFLGELPFSRVLEAYRAAHIFVLPCVVAADGGSDVTPNALIEAMAMQLAVVSTPIAAIPEIVEDGTSGVLVPPRDPVALADALARLLADAELRARLGTAARKRIEERFDIERNIRSYVALFHG